jgi:hypothetical protein
MTKTYENVTITKGETAGILWLETEARLIGVQKVGRYGGKKFGVHTLYQTIDGTEIFDVVTGDSGERSWITRTYQEVQ